MRFLIRIYITVLFYLEVTAAASILKFSLSDGMIPEKGKDISLTCDITSSDQIETLNIFKGSENAGDKLASCFIYSGGNTPCSKYPGVSDRYTFTNTQQSVIVSISNLQISDAGHWYCGFQTTTNTLYTLSVYSSPVNIELSGTSGPEDLSMKGVDLTCKTTNCVYPAPADIQWLFKKADYWLPYQNLSASASQSTCSGNEKIYSSTLSLAKHTAWPFQPTNTDITVQFQCRLAFPTHQSPLQSNDSNHVRYAVQVNNVTIYVGSAVAANPFQVFTGESIKLTCRTSISRPEAVIVWYIGSQEKQRSYRNNFTFNPENSYNNKDIHCKAFNIQPESQAVNSTKLTLHVQESTSVRSFHVGQNESSTNATFEEYAKDIELTCVIKGMPAASVDIVFEGTLIKKLSNTNKIAYSFQYITCTDGGDYVCRSIDSFGKSTNKKLSLYVECAPRPVRQILHNITTDLGVPVNVSFRAIAYPEPGPKGFHWFKEDRSVWIALLRNEDFKIASAGLETNLTITNVSREHFGKYRLTANNRIGSYNQIFYLSEKENISGSRTCVCTEKSFVTLSIILGVVCTLLTGYSAGLTIMYKRNIKKKDVTFKSRTKSSSNNMTANSRGKEEQDYFDDTANEDSSKQYTELAHYTNAQTTYDRLQAKI